MWSHQCKCYILLLIRSCFNVSLYSRSKFDSHLALLTKPWLQLWENTYQSDSVVDRISQTMNESPELLKSTVFNVSRVMKLGRIPQLWNRWQKHTLKSGKNDCLELLKQKGPSKGQLKLSLLMNHWFIKIWFPQYFGINYKYLSKLCLRCFTETINK